MFQHPKIAITTEIPKECIQPNAVDVTCDTITMIVKTYLQGPKITNNSTVHGEKILLEGNTFDLYPGTAYSFESNLKVEVPEGHVGWLVQRSSLNRNGVFVISGLYDSGFKGNIGGTIYCFNNLELHRGARVAQFVLAKAETEYLYNGQYGEQNSNN